MAEVAADRLRQEQGSSGQEVTRYSVSLSRSVPRGRWIGILSAVGVPPKALKNRHGPCPVCGGKDRFRFDDKGATGSFYCSQCGPGDGIELVKGLHRLDFRDAARLIE